ncbi:hypothetical protein L1987_43558 [Smallanthus sonchifolius]|uniref:Uncharacterized protein n=1 Tax=Smallanthus sonchifolius TaxID=185202 RepID=A0ACB9GLZ2_9ASTR|nr:hypothetical protein L1987_43558 [Smallanthus sonchifolius]
MASSSSSSSSSCINDQPPMIPKTRIGKRKSASSPVRRTSIFRGVTRHRLSGRFEAHLWDKNSNNTNKQNKKGKLGAYDDEEAAAHTYDLAAL